MEKTENKYQRGKIEKIISNQTNDIYYGSSVEPYLTNRLSKHRANYKQWLSGKHNFVTSYEIVKFEDAKIILVEDFPCNTKDQLLAREQFYIDNNDCVNKRKSFCGLSKLEYHKQYRLENKDKRNEYSKQYCTQNKEHFLEYQKHYYERNKKEILESTKQRYYKQNKEQTECECGSKLIHKCMPLHIRTKKHQEFIENQKLMHFSESQ